MHFVKSIMIAAIGWIATLQPLSAAEFTFNEKVNQDIAKKLNIPVYFSVPSSARAT